MVHHDMYIDLLGVRQMQWYPMIPTVHHEGIDQ